MLCHSLDVERKAAQVKQWESTKLTHIAQASLLNICSRFSAEREQKAVAIDAALKRLRQAKKMRTTSLFWKSERPDGIRFKRGNTFNSNADHCDQTHPPLESENLSLAHPLGSEHKKRKLDEAEVARLESEKARLLRDASDEVNALLQSCMTPITRLQWSEWLDDNIHKLRELMKTEHIERRKQNSG